MKRKSISRLILSAFLLASSTGIAAATAGVQDGCANALPLTVGGGGPGMVQGQTLQYYQFQAYSLATYSIYTSGNTDTVGQLLDANCNLIAENDDGGGNYGYNFHIERQLSPGIYYVSVRGYSDVSTGPYTIHLDSLGGQAAGVVGQGGCANALPLNVGGGGPGTVQGMTLQYYQFQVYTPGIYSIYTSGNTDTVGQLLDANCNLIAENDDGGGEHGFNFHIEQQLSPGIYYISVRGYSDVSTGPYTIHLDSVGGQTAGPVSVSQSSCANALPVNVGGVIQSTIQGQTLQYFQFQAVSPGLYSIYTEGGADTVGQLFDANCSLIADNDDGGGEYGYNFHIERQLSPGTYYIAIRGYSSDTSGVYVLQIEMR